MVTKQLKVRECYVMHFLRPFRSPGWLCYQTLKAVRQGWNTFFCFPLTTNEATSFAYLRGIPNFDPSLMHTIHQSGHLPPMDVSLCGPNLVTAKSSFCWLCAPESWCHHPSCSSRWGCCKCSTIKLWARRRPIQALTSFRQSEIPTCWTPFVQHSSYKSTVSSNIALLILFFTLCPPYTV